MYRILGFDCYNEAAGLLCVLNSSIVFGICHSSLFFYQVRCRRTETIGFIATALAVAQRPSAADSSQAKAARRWLRASARVPCLLRVHSRFRAAHRPVYFSVWTYNGTDRKSSSQLWMFFKLDCLTLSWGGESVRNVSTLSWPDRPHLRRVRDSILFLAAWS